MAKKLKTRKVEVPPSSDVPGLSKNFIRTVFRLETANRGPDNARIFVSMGTFSSRAAAERAAVAMNWSLAECLIAEEPLDPVPTPVWAYFSRRECDGKRSGYSYTHAPPSVVLVAVGFMGDAIVHDDDPFYSVSGLSPVSLKHAKALVEAKVKELYGDEGASAGSR